MNRYEKCKYHGRVLQVRSRNADGTITLISSDESFEKADGGWKRVDKFESEKIVPVSEVVFVDSVDK